VPLALYEKRYHAGNTHTAWSRWAHARQRHAWIVHCRDMLAEALVCAADATGRWALTATAVARLVGAFPVGGFAWLGELDAPARLALAEDFLAAVWRRTDLGAETGLSATLAARILAAPWLWDAEAATRLAGEVTERERAIERLTTELARAEEQLGLRVAEQGRLLDAVGEVGRANAELAGENARLTGALMAGEAERHRLAEEIVRLRASTSWRVTTPLRALGDRVRARR
jgi:hypothetical protein